MIARPSLVALLVLSVNDSPSARNAAHATAWRGAAARPRSAAPKVLVYVDMDGSSARATFLFRDAEYDPYIDALDSSYQAIVCVGMHARAGTPGFMAHTVTLEPVYTVNGKRITESVIIATSAARFGIPVIMIAGDDVLRGQIAEELLSCPGRRSSREKPRRVSTAIPR